MISKLIKFLIDFFEPKPEAMNDKHIVVLRTLEDDRKATLASFFVFKDNIKIFEAVSVELPDRDNQSNISCVPDGTYNVVLEHSPRFNMDLWELKGVPNRSECKIHSANYAHQLNGCIAPGSGHTDIDGDGVLDVTNSKATLEAFHNAMGQDTKAKITLKSLY